MANNNLIGVITWIVGILVSLAVGSGMIDEVLTIPGIPAIITVIAGWVVVVGAIISVILAIFSK
jgi:purine-cytosine permease-like protein